jgi:hypothetical protein
LLAWLQQPKTQQLLQMLEVEANALQEIVLNRSPGDTGRDTQMELILREQSIGEIRGLRRIANVIKQEQDEILEEAKTQNIIL